jgi:hypothetical protein
MQTQFRLLLVEVLQWTSTAAADTSLGPTWQLCIQKTDLAVRENKILIRGENFV